MSSDRFRLGVSAAALYMCLVLLQTSTGCHEHTIDSTRTSHIPVPSPSPSPSVDPDDGECRVTISEREGEKSSLPGGTEVMRGKIVKFDSISNSSNTNKWRLLQLCWRPYVWLETSMEGDDYVQINRQIFSGNTCDGYHAVAYSFDRPRTLLASLIVKNRTTSLSYFTLRFICPYETQVSTKLFNCREAVDYAMSNNDAFAELEILVTDAINEIVTNRKSVIPPHLCEMAYLAKIHSCYFTYLRGRTCVGTSGEHVL